MDNIPNELILSWNFVDKISLLDLYLHLRCIQDLKVNSAERRKIVASNMGSFIDSYNLNEWSPLQFTIVCDESNNPPTVAERTDFVVDFTFEFPNLPYPQKHYWASISVRRGICLSAEFKALIIKQIQASMYSPSVEARIPYLR